MTHHRFFVRARCRIVFIVAIDVLPLRADIFRLCCEESQTERWLRENRAQYGHKHEMLLMMILVVVDAWPRPGHAEDVDLMCEIAHVRQQVLNRRYGEPEQT